MALETPVAAQGPALAGKVHEAWGGAEAGRCVPDVSAALETLPVRGMPLGFDPGGERRFFPPLRHWQGVQRLAIGDARWLVASRSGSSTGFVVIRMESREPEGFPFGASRAASGTPNWSSRPPATDAVVFRVESEPGLGHAGGIQATGAMLAVPYEARGDSAVVVFYDLSNPASPRRLGLVRRPAWAGGHASLVAVTRLADGRVLLVVGARSSEVLEFLISETADPFASGPHPAFTPVYVERGGIHGGFQNLNFVTQCDGTLYLVGMGNTGFPPPNLGEDQVEWFAVRGSPSRGLRLEREGWRRFDCRECNFGAGGGVYVTPSGRIVLYGIGQGLGGPESTAELEEFAPL
ncbi:MAG: hypothetical protein ACREMH_04430 [Gemmatimonadales bacterium]